MITSIANIKHEKKAMTQLLVLQIYWAEKRMLTLLEMFMEHRKGDIKGGRREERGRKERKAIGLTLDT